MNLSYYFPPVSWCPACNGTGTTIIGATPVPCLCIRHSPDCEPGGACTPECRLLTDLRAVDHPTWTVSAEHVGGTEPLEAVVADEDTAIRLTRILTDTGMYAACWPNQDPDR